MSSRVEPLVGAVILNWNLPADTIRCIRSVLASDYASIVPIVVDNASTDDSVERIRAAFPEVELLQAESNRGYTGGNNLGLARALELGVDFVLILNNDTVVQPECVSTLVAAAMSEERAGLVGPMVIDEPAGIVGNVGGEIHWPVAEPRELGRGGTATDSHTGLRDVPYVPGTAVLARASAIREIGPMPEKYFIYFEDVAWSLGFQGGGWRTIIEPRARVHHWHSSTMGSDSPIKLYYYVRNNLYFIDDWCPPEQRRRVMARFHFKCLKLGVKYGLRGRATHLRGILAGHVDYRRRRSGRTERKL